MNCEKGDLARVISPGLIVHCGCGRGSPMVLAKPDTFVRCIEHSVDGGWTLEEPIPFHVHSICGTEATGDVVGIADYLLRPIGNPGPDAVDELLDLVGAHTGLVGMPA